MRSIPLKNQYCKLVTLNQLFELFGNHKRVPVIFPWRFSNKPSWRNQEARRLKAEWHQFPQSHLTVNLARKDSRRRHRDKLECQHCSRSLWQRTLPRLPGTSPKFLVRAHHASISVLQWRRIMRVLPRVAKNNDTCNSITRKLDTSTIGCMHFQPETHCSWSEERIDTRQWHHKPYNWSAELLSDMACPVPSISVYLEHEKLIATQLGLIRTSQILFPGLLNFFPCSQLCTDLERWIELEVLSTKQALFVSNF